MAREAALVRMLRAGQRDGNELGEAMDNLARVFGRTRTAERVGPHFTCKEANYIAAALIASRNNDAAIHWLDAHAASDSDEDAHGDAEFDAEEYLAPYLLGR